MVLPNKVYDILKWVLLIVVPAFITLLTALTHAWGWEIPIESIVITITSCAAFLGIIFKISDSNYYKDKNFDDGDAFR